MRAIAAAGSSSGGGGRGGGFDGARSTGADDDDDDGGRSRCQLSGLTDRWIISGKVEDGRLLLGDEVLRNKEVGKADFAKMSELSIARLGAPSLTLAG